MCVCVCSTGKSEFQKKKEADGFPARKSTSPAETQVMNGISVCAFVCVREVERECFLEEESGGKSLCRSAERDCCRY